LVIVLALIGAAILTQKLSLVFIPHSNHVLLQKPHKPRLSPWAIATPVVVVSLVTIETFVMLPLGQSPTPKDHFPEWAAVQYLESGTKPDCPVLQLPVESTPGLKIGVEQSWPDTYYRAFVPYLLDPSRAWSFGDFDRVDRDDYLDALGPVLSVEALELAQVAGFCAILFDKTLSQISESSGANLPGTYLKLGKPAFKSERFDVYLMDSALESFFPDLKIGTQNIDFRLGGNAPVYQQAGFHKPETGHTWGNESYAKITFSNKLDFPKDLSVYWKAWAHTPSIENDYPVEVYVNDTPVTRILISGVSDTYKFTIPAELGTPGFIELKFQFLPPTSPCSTSDSGDCRNLSVAFQELRFAFD
jgi:hypothetical protein